MITSAYCRVSTEKDEQLESLEKQIEYFRNICKENGNKLYKVYADEGIKGTQLKKRDQFLQMMKDAEKGYFEALYVKDVSRFARNTLDFIENFRKLKNMGIKIYFVSMGLEAQEASEFLLTMLAALAQEESANLSKKVKFGKDITAKKGRVPNFVFGYDRIDKYTLKINEDESKVVKKIFDLFVNEGYGTSRIAGWLNNKGVKTKKNKQRNWHQVVVTQILRNKIYIGKIVNKKSEVVDFLTGKRNKLKEDPNYIVYNPEIRIISDDVFYKAQEILKQRRDSFNLMNKRPSFKYPLSNLIKCSECGYSFRRLQRQYSENGKVYKRWVDSLRNAKGTNACINKVVIDEEELENAIKIFIKNMASNKTRIKRYAIQYFNSMIKNQSKDISEMQRELLVVQKEKEKYMDMYKNDVISMNELKEHTKDLNRKIKELETSINLSSNKISNFDVEKRIDIYFKDIGKVINEDGFSNEQLKKIINKIVVYPNGEVKINTVLSNELNIELSLEEIINHSFD